MISRRLGPGCPRKPCVSKQCPADGVWRIGRGDGLQAGFSRHGLPPQRAPLDTVYPLREHLNNVQQMVSGGYCEGLFPDTVCWTRLRNTWLKGVAFMTILAVLTVLVVLESTLPSLCLSYKKNTVPRDDPDGFDGFGGFGGCGGFSHDGYPP